VAPRSAVRVMEKPRGNFPHGPQPAFETGRIWPKYLRGKRARRDETDAYTL
jgi:hypothetical protein